MRHSVLAVFLVAFSLWSGSVAPLAADTPYPNIAPTEPKTPEDERKTFKLPPGFEAQLVASEPDIRKPIQMAFDAKGRLWVTTSEEYPFAAVGRPGKDRLYVLDDFGPDGKAKKVSIFADDLNIPIGIVPLPDCKSAIVSSIDPGNGKEKTSCWIWKLTDTDGDGKYDKKEKLYGPFGCEDTHGMNNSYTLMPDGWIYACHGFRNDSKPKGKDGHEIVMNSGNTFRFRPDGSRIENWTYGQVNPFGIAVDPWFNLYTADCHSKPITQLIRGATYQSFSKPHDGLGFAPHVTIHGHDSTALCGPVYYAADHFPKEYLDHMFLGNVTSNCINWDKIEFKGSTPVAIDKGMFLSSSDLWFRPTDMKLGPDGALYFTDFYNKIIGHYEVDLKHPQRDKLRGRVWRIVWKGLDGKGEAPKMMADLKAESVKSVHEHLADPNLSVRMLATQELIERGPEWRNFHEKELEEKGVYRYTWAFENEGNAHLLWYDYRTNLNPVDFKWKIANKIQAFRNHPEGVEAVHAVRIAVNASLESEARDCLGQLNPTCQRVVVEALTFHPHLDNIRPLLDLLARLPSSDDHLRHATRLALRESFRPLADWEGAIKSNTSFTPAEVRELAQIALGLPTQGSALFLKWHRGELAKDSVRLPAYVEHGVRYSSDEDLMGDWFGLIRNFKPEDLKASIQLFNAYHQGIQKRGGKLTTDATPLAYSQTLTAKALDAADPDVVIAGIDLANSLKLAVAFDPLAKLAERKDRNETQRASALAALSTIDAAKAAPLLIKPLNDASEPILLREKSAQILAGQNRVEAQDELVKALQAAPARLQTAIAMGLAVSPGGAEKLFAAIETGKASARLLQEKAVEQKILESKLPKAGERIAALTKGLPSADQKMTLLMKSRSTAFGKTKADAVLGKLVFTKSCAICHQIGNEGVKIGPQLEGIGGRGLERLLEDILDPSRNVDAAFRSSTLTLKDGKSFSGLVLREEGQIVVVADDKGKEIRIPKDDIEERRTSLLSPMPANLVETIPEKEFHDLMAYLLTQRAQR